MKYIVVAATAMAVSAGAMADRALAQNLPAPGAPAQINQTQALTAQEFAAQAAMGNHFEIETSRRALQMAQSNELKEAAQQILDDHATALLELQQIVATAIPGFTLSETLDAEHQQKLDPLNVIDPTAFDRTYIEIQVEAHQDAIDLYENYSRSGDNAELQAFATDTLPTLEEHLRMIEDLQATVVGAAEPAPRAGQPPAAGAPADIAAAPRPEAGPMRPEAGAAGQQPAAGAPADIAAAPRPDAGAIRPEAGAAGQQPAQQQAAAGQQQPGQAGQAAGGQGAEIVVRQQAPVVEVEQAQPQIAVTQPQSAVTVQQAAPEIIVQQAEPVITIQMPQPTVTVDLPEPNIIVRMPEPQVAVNTPQPQITVEQAQPTVRIEQGEPQVVMQPAVEAPAVVQMGQEQQAAVNIQQAQPTVQFQQADPRIEFQPMGEPQVTVNRVGEAQVTVERLGEQQAAAAGLTPVGQAPAAGQQAAQAPMSPAPAAQAPAGGQDVAVIERPALIGEENFADLQPGQLQQFTVNDILAMDVVGADGATLGDIEEVIRYNNSLYVVIGSGGFLGLGERQVALPLGAMRYNGDDLVAPGVTEEQIARMQEIEVDTFETLPADFAADVTLQ